MSLRVWINTKTSAACHTTMDTNAPMAAPFVCNHAGGGTTVSNSPRITILATKAPMAMGMAKSRYRAQISAMSKIVMADKIHTMTPATSADKPAAADSTIKKMTAVSPAPIKVGQDAWSSIPHQPRLLTGFFAMRLTSISCLMSGPFRSFCRPDLVELAIVRTPSNPWTKRDQHQ